MTVSLHIESLRSLIFSSKTYKDQLASNTEEASLISPIAHFVPSSVSRVSLFPKFSRFPQDMSSCPWSLLHGTGESVGWVEWVLSLQQRLVPSSWDVFFCPSLLLSSSLVCPPQLPSRFLPFHSCFFLHFVHLSQISSLRLWLNFLQSQFIFVLITMDWWVLQWNLFRLQLLSLISHFPVGIVLFYHLTVDLEFCGDSVSVSSLRMWIFPRKPI